MRAALERERAARIEAASGRNADGTRRLTLQQVFLGVVAALLDGGHRAQERLGVGVAGVEEDRVVVRELDDLAEIHHGDAGAGAAHHGEIVGDEDVGEAVLGLQLVENLQEPRLLHLIERRQRLVQDQQARLQYQRAGEIDALTLAGAQPDLQMIVDIGRQADLAHHLAHTVPHRAAPHAAVDEQGLQNGAADRHVRRHGVVRVLKQELEAVPEPEQPTAVHLGDAVALEEDRALVGGLDPAQETRERRLAAAGLAHDAEVLPRLHVEGDAAHRLDIVVAEELARVVDAVGLVDVVHREERALVFRRGLRALLHRPDARDTLQQPLGVVVLGPVDDGLRRRAFDDPPFLQDDDFVRDLTHHGERR